MVINVNRKKSIKSRYAQFIFDWSYGHISINLQPNYMKCVQNVRMFTTSICINLYQANLKSFSFTDKNVIYILWI